MKTCLATPDDWDWMSYQAKLQAAEKSPQVGDEVEFYRDKGINLERVTGTVVEVGLPSNVSKYCGPGTAMFECRVEVAPGCHVTAFLNVQAVVYRPERGQR